jgi:hypothetical protein
MLTRIGLIGLVAALALVACVSETQTRKTGNFAFKPPPKEGTGQPAAAAPKPPPTGHKGTISVPNEVLDELKAFVDRERVILADRIEVDASRIPFQRFMVPMADGIYVEQIEVVATRERAAGMIIRPKGGRRAMVAREFPRLRLGNGIELVAGKEILVRLYTEVEPGRPMFVKITGIGNAVYRDPETGERLSQDSVQMVAEVVDGPSGPKFRQRVN